MKIEELDFIFPFVVFAYGFIVLMILNNPKMVKIAEERLPSELWNSFKAKEILAYFCFVVGGLWSLQNLLLGP